MRTSEATKNQIKSHEGLGNNVVRDKNGNITRIYAYDDPSGYATIGWGHLIARTCFQPSTLHGQYKDGLIPSEVEELFEQDIKTLAEDVIKRNIKVPLTQHEFDALVISTYNGGTGAHVWKMVNSKNYDDVEVLATFLKIRTSGGKELPGLIDRRAEEAWLYLYGTKPVKQNETVKIQVKTSKGIKEKVKIIDGHRKWINDVNDFADQYAPLNKKTKQFTPYKLK